MKKGRLTIISEYSDKRNNKIRKYYKVRCDCGNEFEAVKDNIDRGKGVGCKFCVNSYINQARKLPGHEAARNALYQDYRKGARSRDYSFSLDIEWFEKITMSNCYYCGAVPNKIIKVDSGAEYTYNGIDRVDNTDGYELYNVVPCCTDCNKAKSTMSHDAYIALCKRVAEKHA